MNERSAATPFDVPRLAPPAGTHVGGGAGGATGRTVSPTVDEHVRALAASVGAEAACGYVAALWLLLQRYARHDQMDGELRVHDRALEQQLGRLSGAPDPTDTFADVVRRVADALAAEPAAHGRAARPVGSPLPGDPLAHAAVEFGWNVEDLGRLDLDQPPTVLVAVEHHADDGARVRVLGPSSAPHLARAVESDYLDLLAALVAADGPVAEVDAFATTIGPPPAPDGADPEPRLDEIVATHARRTPDAVAVRGGTALTYAELVRRSRRLCTVLKARGVAVEDRVGVCTARDEHLAVAILGVLMCGAAFVPLAPDDPKQRREQVVRDAEIAVVIAHGALADDLVDSVTIVGLDEADRVEEAGPMASSGSTAAYVLYTSGSSGRPKGVVVEHRQLLAYVGGFLDRLGVDRALVCAMVQPLTVDSSLTCVGAAWVTGGELQILDRATALDLGRLTAWARQHPADVLKIAPSHLRALQASGDYVPAMPGLALVVGGEASDWRWLQQTQDDLACSVFNHYGPTEATVGVLMLSVTEHRGRSWATTALGRPLRGCEVAVVDRFGAETPAGVRGELVVRGRLVARGYQAEPPDSGFRPWHGAPAYWTGDQGFREADGVICFAGRTDDQVKVRGFRVELGEVERAVRSHPWVDQAVAAVLTDGAGRTSLGCVVQAAGGRERPAPEQLTAHCRALLPEHMVPTRWTAVDELPRTPHGKTDRPAVVELLAGAGPPADNASATGMRAESPDVSDLRETVTAIWRDLLDQSPDGEHQNFFDAGGHSLLLPDLQRAIQNRTARTVALLDLFQHTTIAAQVELLCGDSRPVRPRLDDDEGRRRRREALARRRQQRQKERRP